MPDPRERAFEHIILADVGGRKGQRCRKLRCVNGRAQVQFEDGSTMVVDARTLRRAANSFDTAKSESTLTRNGQRAEGE